MRRTLAIAIGAAAAGASLGELEAEHPIPAPHPVITEVFYDVPAPGPGDANRDGFAAVVGDEFVELFNPHDEAIELAGYVVTDLHPEERMRFRFAFPEPTRLEPGQAAVVFNGHAQLRAMPEPYGDVRTPASGPNEAFGGALVYSAKTILPSRSFNEHGDLVVLMAPDGQAVDVVAWGAPDQEIPSDAMRVMRVDAHVPAGLQRLGAWGLMLPHPDVDGRRFSPGEVPTEQTAAPEIADDEEPVPVGPSPRNE